jgi:hypothetical protein
MDSSSSLRVREILFEFFRKFFLSSGFLVLNQFVIAL